MNDTAEQKARDMLERMGVRDTEQFSAGDLVELANLIDDADRLRTENATLREQLRFEREDPLGWKPLLDKCDSENAELRELVREIAELDPWKAVSPDWFERAEKVLNDSKP